MIVVAHGLEITRLKSLRELKTMTKVVSSSDLVLSVSKFTRDEIINRLESCRKYLAKEVNQLISLKFVPKINIRNEIHNKIF